MQRKELGKTFMMITNVSVIRVNNHKANPRGDDDSHMTINLLQIFKYFFRNL